MELIFKGEKLKKSFLYIISLMSAATLLFLITSISPDSASPLILLIMFVLLYVVFFGTAVFLANFFRNLRKILFRNLPMRRPISTSKIYGMSAVVSGAPVFLLATQSIKSIDFYDIFLMIVFIVIGIVAIYKK